jgi:hypothetical protein
MKLIHSIENGLDRHLIAFDSTGTFELYEITIVQEESI